MYIHEIFGMPQNSYVLFSKLLTWILTKLV